MANEPITTGTAYCLIASRDPEALDSDYVDPVFWFNPINQKLFWSASLVEDNAVWKEVTLT